MGSLDEAADITNDTDYGLTASLFTANGKNALRVARTLRAGTVTMNSFGGRDNGIHAHDQYTQLKTNWIDLA